MLKVGINAFTRTRDGTEGGSHKVGDDAEGNSQEKGRSTYKKVDIINHQSENSGKCANNHSLNGTGEQQIMPVRIKVNTTKDWVVHLKSPM